MMVARVTFHRRDDPANEYRILRVVRNEDFLYSLYDHTGILADDCSQTAFLGAMGEDQMRSLLKRRIADLCSEGLTLVRDEASAFLREDLL